VIVTVQQTVKEESGVQLLPEQVRTNGSTTNSLCITIYPAQLVNLSFKCGDCNKIFKQLPSLKKHAIIHLTKLENDTDPTVLDGTIENKDFDEGKDAPTTKPSNESVVAAEKAGLVKNECNSNGEEDLEEEEDDEEEEEYESKPPPVKRRKPLKDGALIKLETPFKCDHCGMKFAHKKSIYRHVLRQHKEKLDASCELCNRVFANSIALRNHQRAAHKIAIDNDGKEHQCPYCVQKFELKTYLQKHLKLHDNVLYNCEECGKNFRSNKYLTAHRRLHSEEPKIQCSICNKVFMFQFNLREHMGIHSNAEKLFNCEQCNKSFRTQMLLKLHTLNHPTVTEAPVVFGCFLILRY
jgi:DNA-directed RNA polymerase subunit RPC12/RpoP